MQKKRATPFWKDKLAELHVNYQLQVAKVPAGNGVQKKRKRIRVTNLATVAKEINVEPYEIFQYLRSSNIPTDFTKHPTRNLELDVYISILRKFDPEFYQKNIRRFQRKLQAFLEQKETALAKKQEKKEAKRRRQSALKKHKSVASDDALGKRFVDPIPTHCIAELQIEIPWSDVIFEDFQMRFKFNNHFSAPFPVSESRKSFRYLRNYIDSLQLSPLNVHLKGNRVIRIKNLEQLHNVVRILSVKNELFENFRNRSTVNVRSVLEKIKGIETDFLFRLAKPAQQDPCINYLATLQEGDFKPVPVFEIIPNAAAFTSEDTFIFTIKRGDRIFLVWESTVHGRASYVFQSTPTSYEEVLQTIYDYIYSYQKAKRMKLRTRHESIGNLNYLSFITHVNFVLWKSKLENIIER